MGTDMLDNVLLDNILVGQKDRIIGYIQQGKFEKAIHSLSILASLWNSASYSYKGREICDRLGNILAENNLLALQKKTWKTRKLFDKEI